MKKKTLLEELKPSGAPSGNARWRIRRRDGKGKPVEVISHTAFEAYRDACSGRDGKASKLNAGEGLPAFSDVDVELLVEVKPKKKSKTNSSKKSNRPGSRRRQTRKR